MTTPDENVLEKEITSLFIIPKYVAVLVWAQSLYAEKIYNKSSVNENFCLKFSFMGYNNPNEYSKTQKNKE